MSIKNLFKKAVDPKTLTNRAQKRRQAKIDRQVAGVEKKIFARIEQQRQKTASAKAREAKIQARQERKKKLANAK